MQNLSGKLKNRKKPPLKTISKEAFQNSSIYPLSQMVRTKSTLRKIWWTSVLIFGISGSVYQITIFFHQYLQYPVIVNLKVENKISLDFPAVTVCNLNRMKNDFVTCMQHNLPFNVCSSSESDSPQPPTSSVGMSERQSSASCSKQFSGKRDKNIEEMTIFLTKYMALSYEDRNISGYDKQELIPYCFFNGMACKEEDFSYFQNLHYGNCFTFNKKKNNSDVLKISVDKTMALEIILNLKYLSYLDVTSSFGARVVIHDSNEDPNLEEDGINVSPGFETSVKIKQKCQKRRKAPYTDKCMDYGINAKISGNSRRECVQICTQEQNLINCSCVDPTIPALNDQKQCNISNSTDVCCLDRVIGKIAAEGLPCECPPDCFVTIYEKTLSISKWPSPSYACNFCGKNYLTPNGMADVKVMYSTLQQDTYEQIPVFNDSQLYSNLGSLINLWLGLSLLVVFEIIEMLVKIFTYYYRQK